MAGKGEIISPESTWRELQAFTPQSLRIVRTVPPASRSHVKQTAEILAGSKHMGAKLSQTNRVKKRVPAVAQETAAMKPGVSFPIVGIGASAGGLEALEQ